MKLLYCVISQLMGAFVLERKEGVASLVELWVKLRHFRLLALLVKLLQQSSLAIHALKICH